MSFASSSDPGYKWARLLTNSYPDTESFKIAIRNSFNDFKTTKDMQWRDIYPLILSLMADKVPMNGDAAERTALQESTADLARSLSIARSKWQASMQAHSASGSADEWLGPVHPWVFEEADRLWGIRMATLLNEGTDTVEAENVVLPLLEKLDQSSWWAQTNGSYEFRDSEKDRLYEDVQERALVIDGLCPFDEEWNAERQESALAEREYRTVPLEPDTQRTQGELSWPHLSDLQRTDVTEDLRRSGYQTRQ